MIAAISPRKGSSTLTPITVEPNTKMLAISASVCFLILVMMPPVSVWFQFIRLGALSSCVLGFVIKLLCSFTGKNYRAF
jgi:hypothetical protein